MSEEIRVTISIYPAAHSPFFLEALRELLNAEHARALADVKHNGTLTPEEIKSKINLGKELVGNIYVIDRALGL